MTVPSPRHSRILEFCLLIEIICNHHQYLFFIDNKSYLASSLRNGPPTNKQTHPKKNNLFLSIQLYTHIYQIFYTISILQLQEPDMRSSNQTTYRHTITHNRMQTHDTHIYRDKCCCIVHIYYKGICIYMQTNNKYTHPFQYI